MRRVPQSIAFSLLLSGCFGPGEGVEVPVEQIYFPVGLALDGSNQHLFVVSSDFDLQFNGGAVQSYALDELGKKVATPCSSDADCDGSACVDGLCSRFEQGVCLEGDRPEADRLLYPGRCNPITVKPVSSVKIGAFATDVVTRQRPEGADQAGGDGAPERLFIPVRGDSTLHWIDVRGGVLDCGEGADGGCDGAHRAGDEPDQNSRDLRLGPEPFGIAATETGRTIVVTNQTTATASVFVNDWETSVGPRLRFALTTDSSSLRPTGVASLPLRKALSGVEAPEGVFNAGDDQASFLMTYQNSPQVRVLRFSADLGSSPERDFLNDGGGVAIDANSVGSDSRGITVDASARRDAIERCGDDAACVERAELVPLDVYVANRAPASLLIGRTLPPLDQPYFFQSVPLTVGPSRVGVGSVRAPSGELETRVFVICFDSRRIFIYDPKRARFEAELLTGRGPHSIAVDTQASRLYVGHFTDSYIGVFSLDLSHPQTYGTMLGTLGVPKPPRASK